MTTRAYVISATTAARRTIAEPAGLAVSVGFYLCVTAVLSSLWRAAAAANHGAVVGYSAAALTWYIAASEATTVSLDLRLIEETGDAIGDGSVAVELLRPASVVAVRIAAALGKALPRLAALAVAGAALAATFGGAPPRPAALLLAVPSLVLAIACNLAAQHAFSAASFWIRDARSTWFLYQKLVFVVGGMLLPLEVLPRSVELVARALPFMAMAYAPARLASGHFEPTLLLVQCGWLVVLWAAAAACFHAGERHLQAVGA